MNLNDTSLRKKTLRKLIRMDTKKKKVKEEDEQNEWTINDKWLRFL